MNNRFLLLIVATVCTWATHAHAANKRPNIVFFLVDDMGWTDLGCYGSKLYETPNVDRLASNGIRFTNAYAACPVCSPTRHSILSGKYPARSGCTNVGHHLKPEEVTLAEALKEVNYATYFLGKWHLGGEKATLPQGQGFDVNIGGGANGQPASYFYPYKSKQWKGRFNVKGLDTGGEKGEYLTDRLGNEAVKLLEKHDTAKPFLLYFSFYSVHTPIQGRPDLVEKYRKKVAGMTFNGPKYKREGGKVMKQRQDSPEFAAMVQAVDDTVGKVLETLRKRGLTDNTVIFFTSDNGGAAYYKDATCNLPLRGAKGWVYEGGIREPLIVNWPGKIKPGVCDEPVISTDFYPTILDIIGLPKKPKQHVDGVSFHPLLGSKGSYKPRPLFWHYPHNHGSGSKAAAAIRSGNYKLIEFMAEGKPSALYDLSSDIGEQKDLAKSKAKIAETLQAQLDAWQKDVNAPPFESKKKR